MEFHRTIPNGPRAPAEARAMVSDLGADVPGEVLDRVRLVASEIVTRPGSPACCKRAATLVVSPTAV